MKSALAPAATANADSARAAEEARPAANSLVAAVRTVVDARGLALGALAGLALIFSLSWAQTFLVPLLLGIVIAYTLNPLVAWLEAIKIPRAAGTVIVMASVIGTLVLGTYSLRGEMQTIIEQLPEAADKVSTAIERVRVGQLGNIQKIQNAATGVEKATTQAAGGSLASRQPATHVVVDGPPFKLGNFLWTGSVGALGAMVQAAIVVFLVFFCCSVAIDSNAS